MQRKGKAVTKRTTCITQRKSCNEKEKSCDEKAELQQTGRLVLGKKIDCTRIRVQTSGLRSVKATKPQSCKDAMEPQSRKAVKPQSCHGAAKPQSRKDATEPQSRKAAKVVRAQGRSKTQNQKPQWSVRSAVVSPEWCPLTQASPSVAKRRKASKRHKAS